MNAGLTAICLFCTALTASEMKPMKMLFDFTGSHSAEAWAATNDGVMGGLSFGSAEVADGAMRFSGVLSLENNGGFFWIHTDGPFDLSDYEGIRFSVLGDGRTYDLRLQSDAMFRAWSPVAFRKAFATEPGEWIEIFVPFRELSQSWRGRELSGYEFNSADVRRIGFMLADKQAGDFELKVRWLAAATRH